MDIIQYCTCISFELFKRLPKKASCLRVTRVVGLLANASSVRFE